MCGIAAVLGGSREEVVKMGHAIRHRGIEHNITEVDDLKVWFSYLPTTDKTAPIQPYCAGPWMVWMNGFVSNHRELAEKYQMDLKTQCDTEVVVNLINDVELVGSRIYDNALIRRKLQELNGFFSLLIYNTSTMTPILVTDRYGVKQLYAYYKKGEPCYIASEVKALSAVLNLEIDPDKADEWTYSLGVMNDHTVYYGVEKVKGLPFLKTVPIKIGYEEAKEKLSILLHQSFKRNKAKDLKDGVMLSGGIDSGVIAKWMKPQFSFSMDYVDDEFSELRNIKRNSVGVHMTMICNQNLCDQYKHVTADILDDFKAGSCYTNFALTELASKYCTVLYSGAGGDEVFDGYTHRYNRPINDVIRRTLITDPVWQQTYYSDGFITHKEYDWKFLKAILVVEDRMSGFHTMETRYPLLDNDLVDFALSLPAEYRENKNILKDISGLDTEVINGRKRGFSNPYFTNYQWASFILKHNRKPF